MTKKKTCGLRLRVQLRGEELPKIKIENSNLRAASIYIQLKLVFVFPFHFIRSACAVYWMLSCGLHGSRQAASVMSVKERKNISRSRHYSLSFAFLLAVWWRVRRVLLPLSRNPVSYSQFVVRSVRFGPSCAIFFCLIFNFSQEIVIIRNCYLTK